ncbi:MAG: BglG family transcription antiterminator [Eubacteriales bacterium]|nr:BglG family transcription antiterminator [Eubacteriales bacterium]
MTQAYISARCKRILYMLIESDDFVSLDRITEELHLSRRSIYYEICKINDWLGEQGIEEIEIVRGKGIKLEEEMKNRIEVALKGENSVENYIFSPMERIYFIICYIIRSQKPVSVDRMADSLRVSRNTIFNDLRVVVKQLKDYDLNLKYESKEGYKITGDCVRIRALFILYYNLLRPISEENILKGLEEELNERERDRENLEKLTEIEARLNNSYVDGTLVSLSMLIPLMEENDSDLYFSDLRKEELEGTQEFKLVAEYFPKLCEEEKIYLCLHLLGSRMSMNPVDVFESESSLNNYEIAKALVAEFEKIACVIFDEREELERSLYFHLNTSMYRLRYGIQVGNPMLEDISREYPELFDLTRIVSHYLEQQIGLPISDGEVAYLTLHFGAHLKQEKTKAENVRVLIVCTNGISAGNMIKYEVSKILPNIEVVGVISAKEAVNVQKICDVVITTVKMKCLVPVIVVHPILTDVDRKIILNHSMFRNLEGKVDLEKLFSRIKKYVPEESREAVREEMANYFESNCAEIVPTLEKRKPGLLQMLYLQNISVENETFTWEAAIKKAGKPLVEDGSVTREYLGKIISQVRYYGPYMFITKDVVLAHVKADEEVYEMGITMSVFRKPVIFSDFYKAKVVIVMAVKDQEKHLKMLKDIMTLFSVEGNADKMIEFDTPAEVLEFLRETLKEE